MKRAATYLIGAIATAGLLFLALFADGFPRRFDGIWQPDEGMTQGYIIQLSADSLVTTTAMGRPLCVISPATFRTPTVDIDAPRMSSCSPLFDAAWAYALTRLNDSRPTLYNMYMTAVVAPNTDDVATLITAQPSSADAWPMADAEALGRIIASTEYLRATGDDGQWRRIIAERGCEIIAADSSRLYNPQTGLLAGGGIASLAGDMPQWMDDADRFAIQSLTFNALTIIAAQALAQISSPADSIGLTAYASSLARAINNELWLPQRGYYSQYLYGRYSLIASPAATGAGNALAALSPLISTREMASRVAANLPRTPYGLAATFPQASGSSGAPEASAEVQGLWALACGRADNERAVWNAIAVLLRAAGLAAEGTGIDSTNPNVWGAFVGAVARVIFGLNLSDDGLEISPLIPAELAGRNTLTGIRFRDAILNITVEGSGSHVASFAIDGNASPRRIVPDTLTGRHAVLVQLVAPAVDEAASTGVESNDGQSSVVLPRSMSPTPTLSWSSPVRGTVGNLSVAFEMVINNRIDDEVGCDVILPSPSGFTEAMLIPLDREGNPDGYASAPHAITVRNSALLLQAEWYAARELARDIYRRMRRHWQRQKRAGRAASPLPPNPRLTQLVALPSSRDLTFTFEAPFGGDAVIEAGYAAGRDAGGVRTALRSITLNDSLLGHTAMPRRGFSSDTTITLTTLPLRAHLHPGPNTLVISSSDADLRPDGTPDTILIDFIRITPLDE